jgi:hypothetical protein
MNTVLATFIEWAITTAGLAFVLFVCLLSTIGGGHGETVWRYYLGFLALSQLMKPMSYCTTWHSLYIQLLTKVG